MPNEILNIYLFFSNLFYNTDVVNHNLNLLQIFFSYISFDLNEQDDYNEVVVNR